MPPPVADIFISYAHQDRERIRRLVDVLRDRNWSVFWDRDVRAGDAWREGISKALEGAGCIIVAWSESSVKSPSVMEEAEKAMHRQRLVPIKLDPIEPPFGSGFGEIQLLDLTNWLPGRVSSHLSDLFEAIQRKLGTPTPESGTKSISPIRQFSSHDNTVRHRARPVSRSRMELRNRSTPTGQAGSQVAVPREHLSELKRLQEQLELYYASYGLCREFSELCGKVASRLERSRKEKARLKDPVYWDDLSENLTQAGDKIRSLPEDFKNTCSKNIEVCEHLFEKATRQIFAARDSSDETDRESTATSAYAMLREMQPEIGTVTSLSKQNTDTLLKEMKNVIVRIAEWMELLPEKNDDLRKSRAASYASKQMRPDVGGTVTLKSRTR